MKRLLAAILWLQLDGLNGEVKVERSPPSLSTREGEDLTLHCNYSSTTSDRLHWYRQDLGKGLDPLFSLVASGIVKQEGQFKASLDTKVRRSTLHIAAAQRGLSATYFCAVDTQCSRDAFSLYPNLQPGLWATPAAGTPV